MATPDEQDAALSTYLSITNTASPDHARAALEAASWDVERAVAFHFDDSNTPSRGIGAVSSSSAVLPPQPAFEPLQIDDGDQDSLLGPVAGPSGRRRGEDGARAYAGAGRHGFMRKLLAGPLRVVAAPISFFLDLTLSIMRFVARILRIRLPSLSLSLRWPLWSSSSHLPRSAHPTACAERWVRSLEEELGAVCGSFESALVGSASGVSGLEGASGSVARRAGKGVEAKKWLPGFYLGGYEEAVRLARDQMQILMVVLVTDEHDDVPEFKRTTLLDPELLVALQSNDILIWGGDIRDRDAFMAAQVLDATTYPFVAFLALQPRRRHPPGSTSTSTSPPRMAVCSRHEGPPSTVTSPAALLSHLNATLLPRVSPYLARLKADAQRRRAEALARDQLQRAAEERGRLDRERVMRKKAELEALERARLAAERQAAEAADRRAELLAAKQRAARWRRWARTEGNRVEPEPAPGEPGAARVSFRLGNGKRIVRRFRRDQPVAALYAYVDTESAAAEDEALLAAEGAGGGKPEGYEHEFGFKLCTAMPRRVLELSESRPISELALDGAIVNVEGATNGGSDEESDDEDEEEE